jgi:hypothetical protein
MPASWKVFSVLYLQFPCKFSVWFVLIYTVSCEVSPVLFIYNLKIVSVAGFFTVHIEVKGKFFGSCLRDSSKPVRL